MFIKQVFLFFLFHLFYIGLQAQSKLLIDSLNNRLTQVTADTAKAVIYSKLAYQYSSDFLKAVDYVKKGLILAKGDKRTTTFNQLALANAYAGKDEWNIAESKFDSILADAKKNKDERTVALCTVEKAYIYSEKKMYDKATKCFFDAIKLGEKSNLKAVASAYYGLFGIYSSVLDKDIQAYKYLDQALEIAKKNNDELFEMHIIHTLSHKYSFNVVEEIERGKKLGYNMSYDQEKINFSFENAEKCFKIAKKYGVPQEHEYIKCLAWLNHNIGKDSIALKLLESEKNWTDKNSKKETKSWFYHHLAFIKKSLGRIDDAFDDLYTAIELAESTEDHHSLYSFYYTLSYWYNEKSNYAKALEYLRLSNEEREKTKVDENNKSILELTTKYNTEKKEHQIELLSKDKAIQDFQLKAQSAELLKKQFEKEKDAIQINKLFEEKKLNDIKLYLTNSIKEKKIAELKLKDEQVKNQKDEIRKQNILKFTFAGALVLALIAAFLILRSYKQKKKANEQLALQKVEIEEKNEELNQQKEELQTQKEHLEEINIDLKQKNEEINSQKEELHAINDQLQFTNDQLENLNLELKKLSIIASETDNSVLVFDSNYNLEWTNKAFTQITGYTLEEYKIQFGTNIRESSDNPDIIEALAACTVKKHSVTYQSEATTKTGEKKWIQTTLSPIFDEDGKIIKLIAIDADITAQKIAENEIRRQKEEIEQTLEHLKTTQNQLVESEKMASLGGLVAGVAHEINTPVGISITAASTLADRTRQLVEDYKIGKMKKTDLDTYLESALTSGTLILENLERTGQLIQSFKQVSVDQTSEQQREFNFNSYLNDVVRSLHPKIKHTKLSVEIECSEDIIMNSFPGPFAQIITNFIVNSIIHGFDDNQEGILKLFAKSDGKNLNFIYSDNGKGMSKETLKRVYEPFFTTNKQRGTGLGMNIIYNLVTQKLKGEISAWSEQGKGVRFMIIAPITV